MKTLSTLLLALATLTLLTACKPDYSIIEVYTSDIELAKEGEVILTPAQFKFGLLGDDEEGLLDQAVETTKKYLPENTTFTQSQSDYQAVLVVDTYIPIGNRDALANYITTNKSPVYIEVGNKVVIKQSRYMAELNQSIRGLNMMLSAELPASETTIRLISDSRKPVTVEAISVFVSERPHLQYSKTLNRRDSIDIVFNGGSGSVYSGEPIQFNINAK